MLNLFSKSINIQVILLAFLLDLSFPERLPGIRISLILTQMEASKLPIGPTSTIYWTVTPEMEHSDYSTTNIAGMH